MLLELVLHTPIYVWVIICFLMLNGFQSYFTRVRSLPRLFIVPLIFLWMEFSSLKEMFGLSTIHLAISIGAVSVGMFIGIYLNRNQKVVAQRPNWLVRIPGDKITLLIIIITFIFQYSVHALFQLNNALIMEYELFAMIGMGFMSGISLGRNLTSAFKYFTAEQVCLEP